MALYSTVDCSEEFNTQQEGHDVETGRTASVVLRCAWIDRHALMADILGNRRPWPHGGFSEPPTASSASCSPAPTQYATSGQACEYIDALVTVNYTPFAKDLISESLEPTAEFSQLDFKRFRWTDKNGDPLLEAEAPGRLIRGLNLVRTLYEVQPPLPIQLLTLVGKCNKTAYYSALLNLMFDKETLLYGAPKLDRTITTQGSKGWNITLKFTFKPETWNKYWRSKTETYEYIYDVEGNNPFKSYPPDNFAALLF